MIQLTYADFRKAFAALRSELGYLPPIVLDIGNNLLPVANTKGRFSGSSYWFLRAHSIVANNDNTEHWS